MTEFNEKVKLQTQAATEAGLLHFKTITQLKKYEKEYVRTMRERNVLLHLVPGVPPQVDQGLETGALPAQLQQLQQLQQLLAAQQLLTTSAAQVDMASSSATSLGVPASLLPATAALLPPAVAHATLILPSTARSRRAPAQGNPGGHGTGKKCGKCGYPLRGKQELHCEPHSARKVCDFPCVMCDLPMADHDLTKPTCWELSLQVKKSKS
jgi:hypothetical protein